MYRTSTAHLRSANLPDLSRLAGARKHRRKPLDPLATVDLAHIDVAVLVDRDSRTDTSAPGRWIITILYMVPQMDRVSCCGA